MRSRFDFYLKKKNRKKKQKAAEEDEKNEAGKIPKRVLDGGKWCYKSKQQICKIMMFYLVRYCFVTVTVHKKEKRNE